MCRRKLGYFIYFISMLLGNASLWAEKVEVTGEVSSTSLSVNVTVSNVEASKVPTPDDQLSLLKLLEIALGNTDGEGSGPQTDSNPILHQQSDAASGRNKYFYWAESSTATYTTNDDGTLNLTYTISVVPNPDTSGDMAKVQDKDGKSITVRVQFSGSSNWTTKILSVLYSKPGDALRAPSQSPSFPPALDPPFLQVSPQFSFLIDREVPQM